MMSKSREFFQLMIKSFLAAIKGLSIVLKERNFRIHVLATVAVMIFGFVFGVSLIEWAVLLLTITLVLSLESINTAIEKIADKINPNYDPDIRDIKDVAAGAVLLASIIAVIVGALVFLPKLHEVWNSF